MNRIVLYSTRGGNTEKVALEVASELNCKAVKITKNFDPSTLPLDDFDMVFVGTGIYGGEPSAHILNYLKGLNLQNSSRKFALFMTWAGGGISDKLAFERMRLTLKAKGQQLLENYYICFGKTFNFARRSNPNAEDFDSARKWASDLKKAV